MIDGDGDGAYGRDVPPASSPAQPQHPRRRASDQPDPGAAAARPLRVAPEPGEAPRRSRLREWPITVVVLGLVVGMMVVALGFFRVGAVTLSGAALMALFLRVLLPTRDVGLLAVRGRWVDVGVLAMLSFSLALFAFWVPTPG